MTSLLALVAAPFTPKPDLAFHRNAFSFVMHPLRRWKEVPFTYDVLTGVRVITPELACQVSCEDELTPALEVASARLAEAREDLTPHIRAMADAIDDAVLKQVNEALGEPTQIELRGRFV